MNCPKWSKPISEYISAIESFDFCKVIDLAKFDYAQCSNGEELEHTKTKIINLIKNPNFANELFDLYFYYLKKIQRNKKKIKAVHY